MNKLSSYALCAMALALFLLARPYVGVDGDGVLYFGQALRRSLMPGLNADIFFAGGSQDQFTLYSWLLAPLYRTLGPALTHHVLLLAALLGSACAAWRLLLRLQLQAGWGLLALAVMSPLYGGLRKFAVTQNVLTARSLAEPLVLASLPLLVQGRLVWGLAVQLIAALFHPLLALPALAVTWLMAVQRDRRWLLLAPAALAAACAVAPARITAVYDDFWWALVSGSNVQVLLSNWTWADALVVLTDTALLALAARAAWLPEGGRQLLRALLIATAGLLAMHAIGTDLLHGVLVTQLQSWRVLWLTHLLATLLAPYLVWQTWQQGGLHRLSAALLVLMLMNNHAASTYGGPLLVGWALCVLAASRGATVAPRVITLGVAACAALLLAMAGMRLSFEFDRLYWRPPTWPALDKVSHVLTTPVLAFALAGLMVVVLHRHATWRRTALAFSALLLGCTLWQWDRRDNLARAIESPPAATPFADVIPADATVFWPEQLAGTWGLLQRVSHYNRQQGAGMLFNRATAELMAPRREAYTAIRDDVDQCELGAGLSGTPDQLAACSTPTPARLSTLCAGPVHPDYLVLERPLPTPPLSVWALGTTKLHLYACRQLASGSSIAAH